MRQSKECGKHGPMKNSCNAGGAWTVSQTFWPKWMCAKTAYPMLECGLQKNMAEWIITTSLSTRGSFLFNWSSTSATLQTKEVMRFLLRQQGCRLKRPWIESNKSSSRTWAAERQRQLSLNLAGSLGA